LSVVISPISLEPAAGSVRSARSTSGRRKHDLLASRHRTKHRVPLDIGPTRYGITRGGTIYFFDPSGNRNETFCGGYIYYPDRPTLTWTGDELGRAIFYYDRKLNENFLATTT
jgi:hypothetical protein